MATILVAGSDFAEREGRALLIEISGHKCAMAGSLKEALELLKEDSFELAVTDLQLDGGMPAEIVSRFKGASPKTAVLAITKQSGKARGADSVLTIPCSPKELFQSIENLLGKIKSPAGPISAARIKPHTIPQQRAAKGGRSQQQQARGG